MFTAPVRRWCAGHRQHQQERCQHQELDDDEDLTATEQVERDFVSLFIKRELEQWEGTDETHWLANMTLALFRQWFDIECFDMVLVATKV